MMMSNLSPKVFTPRQATQMLPLVQSIVGDIVELTQEVMQTRQRLMELGLVSITSQAPEEVYSSELLSIREDVAQQLATIESFEQELQQLGLGTSRVEEGFIDFPAIRRNEPIVLCWKLGESEVRHWHRLSETCEHRQLLDLELIRQSGDHASL